MANATTNTKWTPGPWEVNGDRDEDGLTVEARGGEVAFIATTTSYARADVANAHLIAKAPDMAEALRKLLGLIRDCKNVYQNGAASWLMSQTSFLQAESLLAEIEQP